MNVATDSISSPQPKSALISNLLSIADTYLGKVGIAESTLSKRILNRSSWLASLRAGTSDLGTAQHERAMQWFSDNWPENAVWPENVDRPSPTAEAAE